MTEYKGYAGLSEAQLRVVLGQMFAQGGTMLARPGVVGAGSGALLVSQTATASGSVQVASGMAACQDTALNGMTPVVNDANPKTLDVLGPNPISGNPRNDIVVADAATGTITTVTGTASATPTDPTVPATATPLARLRIQANATGIPASQIDDLRVPTGVRGEPVRVSSQAMRDRFTPTNGDRVLRMDLGGIEEKYLNGAWVPATPVGTLWRNASWSLASGTTPVKLPLNTALTSAQPLRGMTADMSNWQLVVQVPGLYVCTFYCGMDATSTSGGRGALIYHNGSDIIASDYRNSAPSSVNATLFTVTSRPVPMAAGDTIDARAIQNSGSALNVTNSNGALMLSAYYVGPTP